MICPKLSIARAEGREALVAVLALAWSTLAAAQGAHAQAIESSPLRPLSTWEVGAVPGEVGRVVDGLPRLER
ncbi:MAG: hypothetical protein K2P95_04925, partial [Hyphomonadaceae bacterium]|nr:hypothetical protein [Hyphomonadaceae bacterium]